MIDYNDESKSVNITTPNDSPFIHTFNTQADAQVCGRCEQTRRNHLMMTYDDLMRGPITLYVCITKLPTFENKS